MTAWTFAIGMGLFGVFGGLYAYAPYTDGYCNPYDPYAYAYGACNGYSYSW